MSEFPVCVRASTRCAHMLVLAGLSVLSMMLSIAKAEACRSGNDHRTIFFEGVPIANEAPIAAHIILVEVAKKEPAEAADPTNPYRYFQRAVARIQRVLKGDVGRIAEITIVAPDSDCDGPLTIGESGTVLGRLQNNLHGTPELLVETESWLERRLRREQKPQ